MGCLELPPSTQPGVRRGALKLMLAGGLTPQNVGEAVRLTRTYGVDVSGGVETAEKGIKDADAIHRFVAAVRQADAEQTTR